MEGVLGGTFKQIAYGDTFGVWKYTDNIICKVCGSTWVNPTADGHWCKNCKTEL
jgi:DnaJ-class molecular chaperone